MDSRSASRLLKRHLVPGETILYQSPRKWSMLIGPVFTLPLLALLFSLAYVLLTLLLSGIQTNIRGLHLPPGQAGFEWTLVGNIIRWGMLVFAGLLLIAAFLQFIAFWGEETTLTDRRILGRTGASILHLVNIPFDSISWVDFPNKVLSKGPISIRTRDGKTTILWRLAKPEVFLGFLEKRYSTETAPVISKTTSWEVVIGTLIPLAFLAVGAYWIYTNEKPALSNLFASIGELEVSTLVAAVDMEALGIGGVEIEGLNAQSPPGAMYASAQELADAITAEGVTCKYLSDSGAYDSPIFDVGGCQFTESGEGIAITIELVDMRTPTGLELGRAARRGTWRGMKEAELSLYKAESLLLVGQNWYIGAEEPVLIQVQSLIGGDILDLLNDAHEGIFVNR